MGDGRFAGTDPFYRGGHFDLGPMAKVAVGSVEVLMVCRKQQAAEEFGAFPGRFWPDRRPGAGRQGAGPEPHRPGPTAIYEAARQPAPDQVLIAVPRGPATILSEACEK